MKNTFTKHTRLCLCLSGAIILAALILQVAGLGLNLGIDFTGGSILEYSVGENYDVADVEKILTEVGFTDAHITKAAPSAASEMLQAQRTSEETAEPVLSDEDAAAIESGADAIVVSSLYGQGELDCRGMREKCDEAGLKGIPLVVGGNIVIGKQKFEDVEKRFKDMGFDRAFPPGTAPETTIEALRELLHMDGEQQ